MDNKVQVFNSDVFGKIRTVTIDDEVWFVGKDIAEKLGYERPRDAIRYHILEEDKKILDYKGLRRDYAPLWNGNDYSNKTLINESGMYSLILSSRLPSAKEFKHWITSEVLPTIRKTGTYSVINRTNLSPQLQAIGQIFDTLVMIETKQNEAMEKIVEVEEKVETVESKVSDTEVRLDKAEEKIDDISTTWKEHINGVIDEVCKVNGLHVLRQKAKLFDKLEEKEHCRLKARITRLKKRKRKSGIKSVNCTNITKMDAVDDDKRLRQAFEQIVDEWSKEYYEQTAIEITV